MHLASTAQVGRLLLNERHAAHLPADGESALPKLECESSATLGARPEPPNLPGSEQGELGELLR